MSNQKKIFWGWYIVIGAFSMLTVTYGARYSFGIFVKPMFAEYGWPISIISLGASLNVFMYASGSILTGRIVDRFSPKWMITLGGFVGALGFFLTSIAKTPLQFYIGYGVLCGIGTACVGMVTSGAAVGKWFVRKKGLALGLTSMGIGFGTMLMSPAAGYIVENFHWKQGFIFFGIVLFIVCILSGQILMRKTIPEDYGLLPDGDDPKITIQHDDISIYSEPEVPLLRVLKTPAFWIMSFCFSMAIMVEVMAFIHQVNYAVSLNIGRIAAASSLGLIGLGSIFGRFFFGWLCDVLKDPKYSAALGFLVEAVGMLMILNISSTAGLYIYSLVFGFGYGSIAPAMPALISDRFGRRILGSLFGIMIFFGTGCGGGVGPIIGGLIYDYFGTYTHAWQFNFIMLLIVSVLILTIKPKNAGRAKE